MDAWVSKYHSQIFQLLSKVVPVEQFDFSYIHSRLDNNKKQEIFLRYYYNLKDILKTYIREHESLCSSSCSSM